ncbi:hypothetical protein BaRGS_00039992, partial [Batillaria attramentaria]
GIKGINSVSLRLGDDIHASDGDCVHEDCRRTYTTKKAVDSKLKAQEAVKSPKKQRSLPDATNDNQTNCLFCGVGKRHIRSGNRTPGSLLKLKLCCFRKVTKQDLRAADVVYRRIRYTSFRKTGGQKPRMFQAEEETPK